MLLIFRVDWCADLISYCGDWTYRDSVCVDKDGKPGEDRMDDAGICMTDSGLQREPVSNAEIK